MEFRQEVLNYIDKHELFNRNNKLILGLSGGADSMALAHFLKSEGFQFIAAHCNFQLRCEASDEDQKLVENWCSKNDIKCLVKSFDTSFYAKRNKISIEMAARNLRYEWFSELVKEFNAEVIAVAHHLNDQIETFFLNMLRGAGIRGSKGMLPKNGNVVRPLLEIKREEIEEYVSENQIPYRLDETNADTAFLRNAIRHNVVPEFEKLSPSFIDIMSGNMQRLAGVWAFLEMQFVEMETQLVKQNAENTTIQLPDKKHSYIYLDFLNYLFSKESFSFPMSEIQNIVDAQVGKYIEYNGYVLTKERGYLSITPVAETRKVNVIINEFPFIAEWGNYVFHFKYTTPKGKHSIPTTPDVVWLNISDTDLPLIIRTWEPGDSMNPYGMTGTKKIKKMLTDSHVPSTLRKSYPVLCANEEVVWLPKIRPSRKYVVSSDEEQVLEIRVTLNEL
jgi:tRNA(Ile)-lysidine synthase